MFSLIRFEMFGIKCRVHSVPSKRNQGEAEEEADRGQSEGVG